MGDPIYPENKMKQKLRNGDVVIKVMSNSGNPAMVETLGYAGFDYVVIETEHTPICMEETGWHLPARSSRDVEGGVIFVFPIINTMAFNARERESPIDNKDLKRVFPGDLNLTRNRMN